MLILGTLFPKDREQEIINMSKYGVAGSSNNFEWNVIDGLSKNTGDKLTIINVLPVGTWPNKYKCLFLKDKKWQYNNTDCYEVGGINIPLFKQIIRAVKITKLLKNFPQEKEILLFTAYLPFLKAIYKLPHDKKVTAVITDVPEFYDIHQTSNFRKLLRKLNNKAVYFYMRRVDRFILLTEHMNKKLHLCGRPYIVMEGICTDIPAETEVNSSVFSLLYSGRLNKKYGIDILIDAVRKIDSSDIELWICGSGEMENELREISKIDSRIKFYGFLPHDEAVKLQQQATVLVNPRTNNGEYTKYSFPSKTMEYMSLGKPVMMFRLDGIPKEYDDYLIYIPEENPESIKQTILMLKNMSPDELEEIGKKGQRFVLENKNETVQARRILNFINQK